jgi:asparagine synthetase B (glutamine-hydrolysing)
MKLNLGEKDYETFSKIKQLMEECDDIDHKKNNIDENKEENIINDNNDNFNDINNLLMNSNFEEYLNMIYNRGPDFFEVYSVNKDINEMEDFKEKAYKMNFKELFDYLINTNNKLVINSYLNLSIDNNISKNLVQDSETKNIFQFNGEIYNNITEINKDIISDNFNTKFSLFNLLTKCSKDKTDNIKKYIENYFEIYNNLESDHAFYFHDNINKQILISRDIFGKRSIILYYIKSLSIIILTPILPEILINLSKSNPKNIFILEIPSNHLLLINEKSENKISLYENHLLNKQHLLRFNPNFEKINNYDNLIQICNEKLKQSIRKRLNDIININKDMNYTLGISFSGGLDSTLMTYYTLLETNDNINIDLFNLSFDKSSPDRITGIISYKELIDKFPNRKINLILIDKEYNTDITPEFQKKILNLIFPRNTHMDFNISSAKYLSTAKKGFLVDKIKLLKYFENAEIVNKN